MNCGIFQAMAKTLSGDLTGLKFELDNARKDVRYYTHLAENLAAAGDKDGARSALRGIDETQLGARDKDELKRLRGVLGAG